MAIPILMYHSIGDDCSSRYRRWMVSSKRLESHIRLMGSLGYHFVTVSELMATRASDRDGRRIAAVTFDDGLADFAAEAMPVLDRLGVPASLYITTGYVGQTARWLADLGEGNRPMLAPADIGALARSGIECGAHSHSHPQLDLLDTATAAHEIVTSRDLLGDWLGAGPASFAYPHGYSTPAVRAIVANAGFSSACRVADALSGADENAYMLSRIIMTSDIDEPMLENMLAGDEIRTMPASESLLISGWRMVRRLQSLQRRFARGA